MAKTKLPEESTLAPLQVAASPAVPTTAVIRASVCASAGIGAFNRGLAQPPFSTLILHGFSPDTQTTIPRATWANSQVGARLHTLVFNTEMTAYFLYSHNYSPTAEVAQIERLPAGKVPGLRRVNLAFPKFASVAVTANRPLYLPGPLAGFPFVVRGEIFYKNHNEFNTLAPALRWPAGSLGSFVVHSDQLLWLGSDRPGFRVGAVADCRLVR